MSIITVATFNTHMGLTRDLRPYEPVEVVETLDADVVLLQEAVRTSGPDCLFERAGGLGYDHAFSPYLYREPRSDGRELGVAILSRFPLVEVARRHLTWIPGDPVRRSVIDAGVRDGEGLIWRVHGTHACWLPQGSVPHIAQLRKMLGAPRQRELLAGDLNMWGPVVAGLMPGWRRAAKGRTWPNPRPHSQIDHILVGPDLSVVEGGVLADDRSDHRAVWARLTDQATPDRRGSSEELRAEIDFTVS